MTSATRATKKAAQRRAAEKARSARTKADRSATNPAPTANEPRRQLPLNDDLEDIFRHILVLADLDPPPAVWDNPPEKAPRDTAAGYRGAVRIRLTDPDTRARADTWLPADKNDLRTHLDYCYARFGWPAVADTRRQLKKAHAAETARQRKIAEAVARRESRPGAAPWTRVTPDWLYPVETAIILENWDTVVRDFSRETHRELRAVEGRGRQLAHEALDRSDRQLTRSIDDYFTRPAPDDPPPDAEALTDHDGPLTRPDQLPAGAGLTVNQNSRGFRDLLDLLRDLGPLDAAIDLLIESAEEAKDRERSKRPGSFRNLEAGNQQLVTAKGRRARRIQESAARFPMTYRLLDAPYKYERGASVPLRNSVGTGLPVEFVVYAVSAAFIQTARSIVAQRKALRPAEEESRSRALDTLPLPPKPHLRPLGELSPRTLDDSDAHPFGALMPGKGARGVWDFPLIIGRALEDLGHGPGSVVRAAAAEALAGFPIPWDLQLFFDAIKVALSVGPGALAIEAWEYKSKVIDTSERLRAEEEIRHATVDPDDALIEVPDRKGRMLEAVLDYLIEERVLGPAAGRVLDRLPARAVLTDYAQRLFADQVVDAAAGQVAGATSKAIKNVLPADPDRSTADLAVSVPIALFAQAGASIAVGELPGRITLGTSLLPRAIAADDQDVARAWTRWANSWFAYHAAFRHQGALTFARHDLETLIGALTEARGRYPNDVASALDRDLARLGATSAALLEGIKQLQPSEHVPAKITARQIQHRASAGEEPPSPKLPPLRRMEQRVVSAATLADYERAPILRTVGQWREATSAPDFATTTETGTREPLTTLGNDVHQAIDRAMSGDHRTPGPNAVGTKTPANYLREDINPTIAVLTRREQLTPAAAQLILSGAWPVRLDPWGFLRTLETATLKVPYTEAAAYFHRWLIPAITRSPDAWVRLGHLLDDLPSLNDPNPRSPTAAQPPEAAAAAVHARADGAVAEVVASGSATYQFVWRRALRTAARLAETLNVDDARKAQEDGSRQIGPGPWVVTTQTGLRPSAPPGAPFGPPLPRPGPPAGPPRPFPGGFIAVTRTNTDAAPATAGNPGAYLVLSTQHVGGFAAPGPLREAVRAQQKLLEKAQRVTLPDANNHALNASTGGRVTQRDLVLDDTADTRDLFRIFTGMWTDGHDPKLQSRVTLARTGDRTALAPLSHMPGDAISRAAFTTALLKAAGKTR